jgi:hypothetical protein
MNYMHVYVEVEMLGNIKTYLHDQGQVLRVLFSDQASRLRMI